MELDVPGVCHWSSKSVRHVPSNLATSPALLLHLLLSSPPPPPVLQGIVMHYVHGQCVTCIYICVIYVSYHQMSASIDAGCSTVPEATATGQPAEVVECCPLCTSLATYWVQCNNQPWHRTGGLSSALPWLAENFSAPRLLP